MSTINNGGHAFPHQLQDLYEPNTAGMTLRDYFAAAALQGLISYHGDKMHIVDADGRTGLHLIAYDHADAMLRAREGS